VNRRALLFALLAVGLVGGWALFRPERLWIDATVSEEFPAAAAETAGGMMAEPVALATGAFHSNAHETKGMATLYRLTDGSLTLRLTGFETSNGPDVQVYLVAAPDVNDDETVKTAGFVSLGALKGNVGDQNYVVPTDIDLNQYRAVTIWCRRFSVNFGTAPLS
jgi:hypothetical protein